MSLFAAAIFSLALQMPGLPAERPLASSSLMEQVAGWDDLNAGERDRALKNYRNYMSMPQEKRRDIDQRYEKWKKLTPGDRDRFRKRHDEYRGRGLVDD